ncbi:MAG: GNAT family N-acetyltransferase [Candidatus Pacearchaeota archaeon]
MKIQKIKTSEIDKSAKIFMQAFNQEPLKEGWTIKKAKEHIQHEKKVGEVFVLIENEMEGVATIRKNVGPKGNIAELKDLAISKHNKSKGLGSKFLQELETKLSSKGFIQIFLETYSKSKAINFYRKNKYQVSAQTKILTKKLR